MNLFSLNIFIGSSIFLNKLRDQEMAPDTTGAFRKIGGFSCANTQEHKINFSENRGKSHFTTVNLTLPFIITALFF